MTIVVRVTVPVRVPARAQESREIKGSRKSGLVTNVWAGPGATEEGWASSRAGSGGEILLPLGPPGAAGKGGGWSLGTAAPEAVAAATGKAGRGIDGRLTLC